MKKEIKMATIMEKDVALEVIASTLALVSRKFNVNRYKTLPPVEDQLVNMRETLYQTDPQFINFDEIIKKCQDIKTEYKDILDYSINWPTDE